MVSETPKEKYIREQKEFRDFLRDNPEIFEICKFFKGEEICPQGTNSMYWGYEKTAICICKERNNVLDLKKIIITIFKSRMMDWEKF